MYAPRPRPASRASTLTILDSSPPSSWSGRLQPSSQTSVWSDEGTEMPHEKDSVTVVGEVPLIDFGDEVQETTVLGWGEDRMRVEEPTPGEKLKLLLSQMDAEIRQVTPISVVNDVKETEVHAVGWRAGRERGFRDAGNRSPLPLPSTSAPASPEREEESPPTPPLRLTRTVFSSARKVSGERQRTPTSPPPRIPSRAAALHASTSRSTSSPPPADPSYRPSPLETFIATQPTPASAHPSEPHHSSRSFDRSSSSTSSRKGKEKERASISTSRTPRPRRYAPVHSSTDLSDHEPRKRYPVTPRRVTVDLAPDDSGMFVDGVQELEMRSEIELDLEEVSGEPPPWGESEGSGADEETFDRTERGNRDAGSKTSLRLSRSLQTGRRNEISADPGLKQSETSFLRGETSRSQTSMRSSRGLSGMHNSSEAPILPALPEPDDSMSANKGTEIDNLSSKRASLFRSSARTSPLPSQSPSLTSLRRSQELRVPPQEPLHVNMVLVSTPTRSNLDVGNTSTAVTPLPPGHWQPSPRSGKGNVRFSPLLTIRPDEALREPGLTRGPIHQIRLSPAKSRSPRKDRELEAQDFRDNDTSFIHRLPKTVSRGNIHQPSTTLREAQVALARAAEISSLARAKVERTQRQWLEGLASVQNNAAVDVMRKSWGWGTWAWWIGMELLLLWGVFRVTLDYATSSQYLSSIDPLAPRHNLALSIPLPTAVSAFVIPHRRSANFFDLIESAELWRRFESWSMGRLRKEEMRIGVEGLRMMDGVPT